MKINAAFLHTWSWVELWGLFLLGLLSTSMNITLGNHFVVIFCVRCPAGIN